jgi:hypothetical protein
MDFIYLYEIEQRNLLQLLEVGWGGGWGREDRGDLTNEQYKPNWNCHYESAPYNEYILIKKLIKKLQTEGNGF